MNPTQDRLDAYRSFDLRIRPRTLVVLAVVGGVGWMLWQVVSA